MKLAGLICPHVPAAMMAPVDNPEHFPSLLKQSQFELSEWLRAAPRRKSDYFLSLANLESYQLFPHARDYPRGQYQKQR